MVRASWGAAVTSRTPNPMSHALQAPTETTARLQVQSGHVLGYVRETLSGPADPLRVHWRRRSQRDTRHPCP